MAQIGNIIVFCARIILPILSLLLIFKCSRTLFKPEKKINVGRLIAPNGLDYDINCSESIIGRSKICDLRLNIGSVSRRHAVITYSADYGFKISSVNGSEILVNDTLIDEYAYLEIGDVIEIGGVQLKLVPPVANEENYQFRKNNAFSSAFILTIIQIICLLELIVHYFSDGINEYIPLAFGTLIIGEWVYFIISRFKDNIHIEILGFFLTTIGFCVSASAAPDEMLKQIFTTAAGFVAFVVAGFFYKNIDLVMKLRYAAGIIAIGILAYNVLFGVTLNGAKNWVRIGSYSFQPSELVKFLFIFTTAATLERLLSRRNILLFLGFCGACMGSMVLMRDFGTLSIYFVTMLVILYMRSGDVKIVGGITLAAGAGGFLVAKFVPYVHNRFATYRHAWDYVYSSGFQQTQTMIAIASGALLGLGGGNGSLKSVTASDTDLVFGMVCEEWGMIVALCAIFCFVIFAIYSFKSVPYTNSAFFAIGACSASALFIFQISLNIFGSTDLLPLTGVTLPFISNGGSSMIASWLLLSFIKAIGKNRLKDFEGDNEEYDDYENHQYDDYDDEYGDTDQDLYSFSDNQSYDD